MSYMSKYFSSVFQKSKEMLTEITQKPAVQAPNPDELHFIYIQTYLAMKTVVCTTALRVDIPVLMEISSASACIRAFVFRGDRFHCVISRCLQISLFQPIDCICQASILRHTVIRARGTPSHRNHMPYAKPNEKSPGGCSSPP